MKKSTFWITCAWCGNSVPKERDTAKFCSDKCRTASNRQERREQSIGLDGFIVSELVLYIELRKRAPTAAALVRRVRRQFGLQPARLALYVACSTANPDSGTSCVPLDVVDSMIESDFVLPENADHNHAIQEAHNG